MPGRDALAALLEELAVALGALGALDDGRRGEARGARARARAARAKQAAGRSSSDTDLRVFFFVTKEGLVPELDL